MRAIRKVIAMANNAANPLTRRSENRDTGELNLDESTGVNLNTASGLGMKKGGAVKSKASSRADGCCVRGKTRA